MHEIMCTNNKVRHDISAFVAETAWVFASVNLYAACFRFRDCYSTNIDKYRTFLLQIIKHSPNIQPNEFKQIKIPKRHANMMLFITISKGCWRNTMLGTLTLCLTLIIVGIPVANATCPGCCSSHRGISQTCSANGNIRCNDGTTSPTCTCYSCGVPFNPSPVYYTLNTAVSPISGGTVTSSPLGINCEPDCSQSYLSGTIVTLTATPATGYNFVGWSGKLADCSETAFSCPLKITESNQMVASFLENQTNTGVLGTPNDGGVVSGVGTISGYHCSSPNLEILIDGVSAGKAGTGTTLLGTRSICGHTNTGFSLLYNFNNLDEGQHSVTVLAEGKEFGRATFRTVRSGGVPWLTGVDKTIAVTDFPVPGKSTTLNWMQSFQNFMAVDPNTPEATPNQYVATPSVGLLGTPNNGGSISGIGVISGYHCASKNIEVFIDGESLGKAGSGTTLLGTQSVCGKTDTGFSLLYNFGNLPPGIHIIETHADGVLFGKNSFKSVRSGGDPWLVNAHRRVTVNDFSETGHAVTLEWIQSLQNFVVIEH